MTATQSCANSEAAQKWQEYHLISDVLRGGRPHPSGTAQRVRKALESEPAIVARPKRIIDTTFGRVALAIDPGAIRSYTIPAGTGTIGGTSYVLPGAEAASAFADFADDAVLQAH